MDYDNEPNVDQFGIGIGEERHIEPSPTSAPVEKNVGKSRKRLLKMNATEGLSKRGENPTRNAFSNENLDDRKEEDPVKKRKSSFRKLEKDLSLKKKMKVLPKRNQSGENASSSRPKPYEVGSADHGQEDNETNEYLKIDEYSIKVEKSLDEVAMKVDDLMAQFKLVVEEDFELNRQNKPAINKLKMLPLLQEALSKKKLQLELLDHGILTLLGNWLQPLPDGSLPNMTIWTAILQLLSDFPVDLELYNHREQLKKSGLGKVVMFLSKYEKECKANRKLAKELVDRWSKSIFNKSGRYEDLRNHASERIPSRRISPKRPANKSPENDSIDDDIDEFSQRKKSCQSSVNERATLPEASTLLYVVRPPPKVTREQLRERAIKNSFRAQQEKKEKKRRQAFARLSNKRRRPLYKVQSSLY